MTQNEKRSDSRALLVRTYYDFLFEKIILIVLCVQQTSNESAIISQNYLFLKVVSMFLFILFF